MRAGTWPPRNDRLKRPSDRRATGASSHFSRPSHSPRLSRNCHFRKGKPQTREHYFGLLSYTLLQALGQRQSPMTYRDFARIVDSRYRALRGTRGPTPYCEGDLDREFLGLRTWPNRADVVLERSEHNLTVSGGELQNICGGAILAVRRAGHAAGDTEEVLGYVQVGKAQEVFPLQSSNRWPMVISRRLTPRRCRPSADVRSSITSSVTCDSNCSRVTQRR